MHALALLLLLALARNHSCAVCYELLARMRTQPNSRVRDTCQAATRTFS